MTRRKLTVAVTGLNNIDSPGPGIQVARALKESVEFDIRVIGLSYETLEPGIYMREFVDKAYQIPLPSAGTAILKERLAYIHEQEHLDVIIPNFDAELHNFIKIQDALKQQYGIATALPTMEQFDERHKSNLEFFGKKYGVEVPKSRMIYSTAEIAAIGKEFGYPLVVKGKYYDASVASTPEQAAGYFHKISAKWGLPIILQQFVSGNEVNITAIGDGNGACVGAVPMRKLYITDKGKAWAGVSLEDETLIDIAHKVISRSKWKGGCELEFIKSKEGIYYLLEMNPRFPAWVYLAKGCGQNHPEYLVKIAIGEKAVVQKEYQSGIMFIRFSQDMIVPMKDFETISTQGEF
jgi:carbamoyl-phosphate synthase large subunit